MASGPITSWQTERGKMEAETNFIFVDCGQWLQPWNKIRRLLLSLPDLTMMTGGWQNPWSTLPPSQARGSLGQPYVLSAHCSQEETGWGSAMRLGWSLSCPHHCPAFQGPMAEQPCPGGGRGLGSHAGYGPGKWASLARGQECGDGPRHMSVLRRVFFLKQLKSRNLSAPWWTKVWILTHLCWPVVWDERE